MKKVKILLVLVLAMAMLFVIAGCEKKPVDEDVKYENFQPGDVVAELEYGKDYKALYEYCTEDLKMDIKASDVTVEDGLAYLKVEGVERELGMDFLSMAMVYNAETEEEYNFWWKLYITRWNYLVPEVPLYSNQYFDVYNTKLTNVKEHPTNPYWGPQRALLDWGSTDGKFIMGSSTDLVGRFRYPSFGVTSPSASDNDIQFMTTGLETVVSTKVGTLEWNKTAVKAHEHTKNEDGSETFTITINEGLKFSNGNEIKAVNYLYSTLAHSTPVSKAAGGNGKSGLNFVGFEPFAAFDGKNADAKDVNRYFTGLKLIDDYTFSVTIDSKYCPYYYSTNYASFSPVEKDLWLNGADIIVDEETKAVGISDNFYAMVEEDGKQVYANKAYLEKAPYDLTFGWSGAYMVTKWDAGNKQATLQINPYFAGNYEGTKPYEREDKIEQVVYVKMVAKTQLTAFLNGEIDMLSGITGKNETDEALKAVRESNGKADYIYYNRAGYGKLSLRSDFGPAMFREVRQAISYSIDNNAFMEAFCGEYGALVYGPYYLGSAAYMANEAEFAETLNDYSYNVSAARNALIQAGFIYNDKGQEYKTGDGVRYKKLDKKDWTLNNLTYQSIDGKYHTYKLGGEYYMPCAINWFCTVDNEVSELLKLYWQNDANQTAMQIGMVIQFTQGEWMSMLGELYQYEGYGWQGNAIYSAFNFATGYNSAIYDYAFNWTIDPDMYDDYSINYLKDYADFYYIEKAED